MLKIIRWYIPIVLLLLNTNASAQLQEAAIPYSVAGRLPELQSYMHLPPFDRDALLRETADENTNGNIPCRFAKMFRYDVSPENSGYWTATARGKIWRLAITSAGAFSLYITFDRFYLNKGVRLFMYAPGYRHVKGAFTQRNNHVSGILPIAPVAGDSLIIELDVPAGISDYGQLHLGKVYHDYTNGIGKLNTHLNKGDGTERCSADINCEEGQYWQTEKRAVCRLIINDLLCTGTLIGNTALDNTPYVLTSYHCVRDSTAFLETIAFFNYESLQCHSDSINENHTLSGATLVATAGSNLDFALLKLNEIPPPDYQPYYAGWDITTARPQKGITIHHPWGDKKEISIEYHPLQTADFGQGYDSFSTWKTGRWDVGTTEPGSSGAALFNEAHRIVGTLMGGKASCDNPVDDYFTKLNLSWDAYPHAGNRLQPWLDPVEAGVTSLDGYDPYGFNSSNCDTTWNIQPGEALTLIQNTSGWVSGNNHAGITQFAEKFISPGSIQLSGFFFHTARVSSTSPFSAITLKVWQGDDKPLQELYSKVIFLKNITANAIAYIPADSVIKVKGNFFAGYSMDDLFQSDSFAVYHAKPRSQAGPSSLYVYNGTWQKADKHPAIQLNTSLAVGVIACYGKLQQPAFNLLRIYPNPAVNFINMDIPHDETIRQITCYDISGRSVQHCLQLSEVKNRVYFTLPPGMYFLRVATASKHYTARLLVLR